MSNYQTLFLTAGIIFGVIVAIAILVPYLKEKGVDTTRVLNEVKEDLEDVGDVIKAAKELAPSKALDILELIDNLALRATAKASILAGLKVFNIAITPELEKVIDDAIQKCVLDTKTTEEQRSQKQDILQIQIKDLQLQKAETEAKVTELICQNVLLVQKLNAIQSTVQSTSVQS